MRKPNAIHCLIVVGEDQIDNAIKSIADLGNLDIHIHALWREFSRPKNTRAKLATDLESGKISLSHARNLLILEMSRSNLVGKEDIIFFLDDDAGVPKDLNLEINTIFSNPKIVWAMGNYQPKGSDLDTRRFPVKAIKKMSIKETLRIASSQGIYVRKSTLEKIGLFDENLGVGARIGVGEDTDLALRLRRITKTAPYFSKLTLYHPYKHGKYSPLVRFQFLCYVSSKSRNLFIPMIRYGFRLLISKEASIHNLARIRNLELRFIEKK